jgi:toxin-antitoxin system PIN domain toxin
MQLPDINVWLALAFAAHKHHSSAAAWFAGTGHGTCAFCRMTQQGFLRLATTPKVLTVAAVNMADAWRLYDGLFSDPRVVYAEEPGGIEPLWRGHTQRQSFSPKVWNDAYLAAFAEAANFEVVSFDRGFRQYPSIRCTILP